MDDEVSLTCINGNDPNEDISTSDGTDSMSSYDVVVEWLTEYGYRPYIHETGGYRASLGPHMLNFEVNFDSFMFFVLVPIMSFEDFAKVDNRLVLELANDLNLKLLDTSVKAHSLGPFVTLTLNHYFDSNESMLYSLSSRIESLARAVSQVEEMWSLKQQ